MFSLLMSVFHKDDPVYFREALNSIVPQLRYMDEIVLVKDGPIGDRLQGVIEDFTGVLPIKEVALPENVGLAKALNVGLAHCRSEWVFRFDADDICMPARAAIQWSMINCASLDIVGGQIEEFDPKTLEGTGRRQVPCDGMEIRRFLRHRNPFNHMTVCFRKTFIEKIGGYPDIPLKEDYALWAKALAMGARVANAPDVVVRARAGQDMLSRRGGIRYARSEIDLQWFLQKHGAKPVLAAIVDGMARAAVFLSPISVRRLIFRRYLRRSNRD
jgi:glycosyltransferase involved in cell wall biosynthesis